MNKKILFVLLGASITVFSCKKSVLEEKSQVYALSENVMEASSTDHTESLGGNEF